MPLVNEELNVPQTAVEIPVEFPKNLIFNSDKNYKLEVIATDVSMWNFAQGNKAEKTANIIIDNKKPVINVIAQSYKITKGGSAVVVFGASDERLGQVYIHTNYGKDFKVPGVQLKDEQLCSALISAAFFSVAAFAVIPMQDLFALGSEARMNMPSTSGETKMARDIAQRFNHHFGELNASKFLP